jgi:type VI secretion system secreted protein Hcp
MIDAYLQIDGIKGESTDDKHKDWIEVSNVLYAVNQPRAESIPTAGGHTSARAELYPLTFKKLADIASPVLLQTCAAGKTIPKAVFEFMRADGDGKPIPYFKIELEHVMIASVTPDSGEGGDHQRTGAAGLRENKMDLYPPKHKRRCSRQFVRRMGLQR